MKYLRWLIMFPTTVWEFTVERECKDAISWTIWANERTCHIMRTNIFLRWLKCHHQWKTYAPNDTSWCNSHFVIYGELRYDAKKIKVCNKCGEVRTVGRSQSEKW